MMNAGFNSVYSYRFDSITASVILTFVTLEKAKGGKCLFKFQNFD